MNLKLTFLGLTLLLSSAVTLHAQRNSNTAAGFNNADYPQFTISATASTQGIGGDLKWQISAPFAVRTGVSVLPFDWQTVYTGRSEPTDLHLKVNFANAHLYFDWHPLDDRENLLGQITVTAGGAYWWKDRGTAVFTYRGNYKYGDIVVPSNELGQLTGEVQWKKVTPYLGMGLYNILSPGKVNLGFALGAYYMGKPEATLTGTKMLAANTSNSEQFQKNMSYYRFLPVFQINLNYSL